MKFITMSMPASSRKLDVDSNNLESLLINMSKMKGKEGSTKIFVSNEAVDFIITPMNIEVEVSRNKNTYYALEFWFRFPLTDYLERLDKQLTQIAKIIDFISLVRGAKLYTYSNTGLAYKLIEWKLHHQAMKGYWNGKIFASDVIQRLISKTARNEWSKNYYRKANKEKRLNGELLKKIPKIVQEINYCTWMIDFYNGHYDNDNHYKKAYENITNEIERNRFLIEGKPYPKDLLRSK